jgi:hypothetical protein
LNCFSFPRALEAFIRAKYEQRKWIAKEWIPPEITVPIDVSVVLWLFNYIIGFCNTKFFIHFLAYWIRNSSKTTNWNDIRYGTSELRFKIKLSWKNVYLNTEKCTKAKTVCSTSRTTNSATIIGSCDTDYCRK